MEIVRKWIGLWLVALGSTLHAQTDLAFSYQVDVQTHYGFILAHRQNIDHVIKGHTPGIELSFTKRTNGAKAWHAPFRFPSVGATYMFLDLGNPDELGYAHAALAFIRLPLATGTRSRVEVKLATGPGFITKRWDRLENHNNILIGSNLNLAVQFQLAYQLRLTQRLAARSSLGLTHFSNGASELPNLGINVISASSGLAYSFGRMRTNLKVDTSRVSYTYGTGILTTVGGFYKEAVDEGGERFAAGSWVVDAYTDISPKSRLSIGVSSMYNGALEKTYRIDEGIETDSFTDWLQFGIHAGYHLKFTRWELFLQNGFYVYSQRYPSGRIFTRIGGRYLVTNQWFVTASLKSHLLKADYFEFGFGRYLWRN